MAGREEAHEARQLESLRERLEQWREQHGGRGRRIPDELWAEAMAVAEEEGVERVACVLRLDRERLGELVTESRRWRDSGREGKAKFIEVELPRVLDRGCRTISLVGVDGEEVRIIDMAGDVDVQALAQAFWSRHQCCS
jgi:hypothetical protein